MDDNSVRTPLVVVGADGSECSLRAVKWAADYAAATGANLRVVTAWQWPTFVDAPVGVGDWDIEQDAVDTAAKAVAELDLPPERVHSGAIAGAAAVVLTEQAAEADVLVVGSRGHGAIAGALLGSISAYCVHHAASTVVVVR